MRRKRRKPNFFERLENRKINKEKATTLDAESAIVNKSESRRKVKLRKNFFPTLIAIAILWTAILLLIYFVDPYRYGALFLFYVLIFLASFFTFSLLFANSRRGVLVSLILIFFLFLRFIGVGSLFNLLLIIGIAITAELYFHYQ